MSSQLHAAQYTEALHALDFIVGWNGGWMEQRIWLPLEERWEVAWHRCGVPGSGRRLVRRVRAVDERLSGQVLLSIPRKKLGGGAPYATVLWARVEGDKQRKALDRFRPVPPVVVQEGASTRAVAFWPLDRALGWEWIVRANKRIAHRLGTPKKWADPDEFLFPAPGSCLRAGRSRPLPVVMTRLEPVHFTARQVVGRLKDAPDPNAWREQLEARGG